MEFELQSQTPEDIQRDKETTERLKKLEDMWERLARPLTGTAGDLTADMFGGDTSLFNERRDK